MSAKTGRARSKSDGVGAGHERERRRDDLVAVRHADRAQRRGAARPCRSTPRWRARRRAARRTPARTRARAARARAGPSAGPRAPRPPPRPGREGPGWAQRGIDRRSRVGLASHRVRRRRLRGPSAPAPGLLGVRQRVDERLPGRGDDVLGDADRAPDVAAVGGVDEHARRRAGAVVLVEDADLEVDELDVLQVRVDLADRVAQRARRAR